MGSDISLLAQNLTFYLVIFNSIHRESEREREEYWIEGHGAENQEIKAAISS